MEQTLTNNLLRYNAPIATGVGRDRSMKKIKKIYFPTPSQSRVDLDGQQVDVSNSEGAQNDEMEIIINSIFPPEEFRDEQGISYRQQVSTIPATADEAKELEVQLDQRLRDRHGRIEGICNIRRELFNQAFDELIRQETLELPERGLLLKRIRDEIRMTYSVYKSLYDSCCAYRTRKSSSVELSLLELEKTIEENEPKMQELRKEFKLMQEKVEKAQVRVVEEAAHVLKQRKEEKDYYFNMGNQMKAQIDKFLTPSKKSELKSEENEKEKEPVPTQETQAHQDSTDPNPD